MEALGIVSALFVLVVIGTALAKKGTGTESAAADAEKEPTYSGF
jgi:hypothetical protein